MKKLILFLGLMFCTFMAVAQPSTADSTQAWKVDSLDRDLQEDIQNTKYFDKQTFIDTGLFYVLEIDDILITGGSTYGDTTLKNVLDGFLNGDFTSGGVFSSADSTTLFQTDSLSTWIRANMYTDIQVDSAIAAEIAAAGSGLTELDALLQLSTRNGSGYVGTDSLFVYDTTDIKFQSAGEIKLLAADVLDFDGSSVSIKGTASSREVTMDLLTPSTGTGYEGSVRFTTKTYNNGGTFFTNTLHFNSYEGVYYGIPPTNLKGSSLLPKDTVLAYINSLEEYIDSGQASSDTLTLYTVLGDSIQISLSELVKLNVYYDSLQNKPVSFTPSAHTHPLTELEEFDDMSTLNTDDALWWNGTDFVNKQASTVLTGWDQNAADDFDGDYNSLTNLPSLFDGDWTSLVNVPSELWKKTLVTMSTDLTLKASDTNKVYINYGAANYKFSLASGELLAYDQEVEFRAPNTGYIWIDTTGTGCTLVDAEGTLIASDTIFVGGFIYAIGEDQYTIVNGAVSTGSGGTTYTAGYGLDLATTVFSADTFELSTRWYTDSSLATFTAPSLNTLNLQDTLFYQPDSSAWITASASSVFIKGGNSAGTSPDLTISNTSVTVAQDLLGGFGDYKLGNNVPGWHLEPFTVGKDTAGTRSSASLDVRDRLRVDTIVFPDASIMITAPVGGTDDQVASEVPITDAGGYFTGTDVEAALQEAGADFANLTFYSITGNPFAANGGTEKVSIPWQSAFPQFALVNGDTDSTEILLQSSLDNWSINTFAQNGDQLQIGTTDNRDMMIFDHSDQDIEFTVKLNVTGDLVVSNNSAFGGTHTPSAPIDVVNTTGPQATIGYDGTNELRITTASDGGVTFDAVGTSPDFTISDNLIISNYLYYDASGNYYTRLNSTVLEHWINSTKTVEFGGSNTWINTPLIGNNNWSTSGHIATNGNTVSGTYDMYGDVIRADSYFSTPGYTLGSNGFYGTGWTDGRITFSANVEGSNDVNIATGGNTTDIGGSINFYVTDNLNGNNLVVDIDSTGLTILENFYVQQSIIDATHASFLDSAVIITAADSAMTVGGRLGVGDQLTVTGTSTFFGAVTAAEYRRNRIEANSATYVLTSDDVGKMIYCTTTTVTDLQLPTTGLEVGDEFLFSDEGSGGMDIDYDIGTSQYTFIDATGATLSYAANFAVYECTFRVVATNTIKIIGYYETP